MCDADAGAGAPSRGRADGLATEDGVLTAYGQSLGVDVQRHGDLLRVVREAFHAPLPPGWTEHTDDQGQLYFFQETQNQSHWEHPMDAVYRELLALVLQLRDQEPEAGQARMAEVIHSHLREVHQRALRDLESWSGPYSSQEGEFYFNEQLQVSAWENPLLQWEQELLKRHAVLCSCLLPEGGGADSSLSSSSGSSDLLAALHLPLNLVRRNADDVPETPSTRSFHTARSTGSPRSSHRASPRPLPPARGSPPDPDQ